MITLISLYLIAIIAGYLCAAQVGPSVATEFRHVQWWSVSLIFLCVVLVSHERTYIVINAGYLWLGFSVDIRNDILHRLSKNAPFDFLHEAIKKRSTEKTMGEKRYIYIVRTLISKKEIARLDDEADAHERALSENYSDSDPIGIETIEGDEVDSAELIGIVYDGEIFWK